MTKLRLEDDDLLGMTLLCRLAHHDVFQENEADGLSMEDIGSFALACHKYGRLEKPVFKIMGEKWMSNSNHLSESDYDVIVAYILANPDLFEIVTKDIILKSTETFKPDQNIATGFGPFVLPDSVIGESKNLCYQAGYPAGHSTRQWTY